MMSSLFVGGAAPRRPDYYQLNGARLGAEVKSIVWLLIRKHKTNPAPLGP